MYRVTNLDTRHHYQDPFLDWAIGGARFGPLHRDVSDEDFLKSLSLQKAYQKRQSGKPCRLLVEYIEDKPEAKQAKDDKPKADKLKVKNTKPKKAKVAAKNEEK